MESRKCPNPTNLSQIWLKTHYFDSNLWDSGIFFTPCVRALKEGIGVGISGWIFLLNLSAIFAAISSLESYSICLYASVSKQVWWFLVLMNSKAQLWAKGYIECASLSRHLKYWPWKQVNCDISTEWTWWLWIKERVPYLITLFELRKTYIANGIAMKCEDWK